MQNHNWFWGLIFSSLFTLNLFAASSEVGLNQDEFRFTSTDHAIISNSKDPTDPQSQPTSVLMHENILRGEYNPYSLGVQFTNRLTPDGPRDVNRPFILDKSTLAIDTDNWEIRAGDTHQELGKGIALSLYRDPVFGIDNTVQGASARYHPQGLDARIFAGRISSLQAPVAINPQPNPMDGREVLLAAGSVTGEMLDQTKVGAHYVYTLNRPLTSSRYDKQWQTVGTTLSNSNLLEGVDTYLESNLLMTKPIGSTGVADTQGYGTYASVQWSASPWKVKVEGQGLS